MKHKIPDIIEKADQKRLVVPKLCIERSNILLLRCNSKDDGSRVTRGKRKNSKNKERNTEENRNHI